MPWTKIKMLSTQQELTAEKCFNELINQCKARNLCNATIRNHSQQWTYMVEGWGGETIASINNDTIMRYVSIFRVIPYCFVTSPIFSEVLDVWR